MPLFRKTALLALTLIFAAQAMAQQLPVPPSLAAKSWLLLEMGSNQVLSTEKPDERLEPASLTKLMTAYLVFAALHKKTLALDQPLPVSEKAWRTGGSKMFVRVDTQVPVEKADPLAFVLIGLGRVITRRHVMRKMHRITRPAEITLARIVPLVGHRNHRAAPFRPGDVGQLPAAGPPAIVEPRGRPAILRSRP